MLASLNLTFGLLSRRLLITFLMRGSYFFPLSKQYKCHCRDLLGGTKVASHPSSDLNFLHQGRYQMVHTHPSTVNCLLCKYKISYSLLTHCHDNLCNSLPSRSGRQGYIWLCSNISVWYMRLALLMMQCVRVSLYEGRSCEKQMPPCFGNVLVML